MNGKPSRWPWVSLFAICLGLFCGGCGGDDPPDEDYNGSWKGTTSGGGPITFTVSDDKVVGLYLKHGKYYLKQQTSAQEEISGNEFSIPIFLATGEIKGTFSSATACSGSYSFDGNVVLAGHVSYSGTFQATRQ